MVEVRQTKRALLTSLDFFIENNPVVRFVKQTTLDSSFFLTLNKIFAAHTPARREKQGNNTKASPGKSSAERFNTACLPQPPRGMNLKQGPFTTPQGKTTETPQATARTHRLLRFCHLLEKNPKRRGAEGTTVRVAGLWECLGLRQSVQSPV